MPAWGKSNVNGYSHHSLSHRHPLSSPTQVDNQSRATKRRRHSSGHVIDLDADDDNLVSSHQHQTRSSRQNPTPSVASVESVEEKGAKRNATQAVLVPDDDSDVEIKSNKKGDVARLRPGKNMPAEGGSIREKSDDSSNSILHLDANDNDAHAPAENTEREITVDQQKLPNDKGWNSDASESPDELQLDMTTQMPGSFDSRRRAIKSISRVHDRNETLVKRMNPRQSPSDIRPTVFNSSNKTQSKIKKPAKSPRHLFEVKFFRYGDVETKDRNLQFFLDDGNHTIGLLAEDQLLLSDAIPVHRVVQALLGTDGSLKCRLKLSKIQGPVNQDAVYVEFANEEDKGRIYSWFRKKRIPILRKEG